VSIDTERQRSLGDVAQIFSGKPAQATDSTTQKP
jgi:hypothetical protein